MIIYTDSDNLWTVFCDINQTVAFSNFCDRVKCKNCLSKFSDKNHVGIMFTRSSYTHLTAGMVIILRDECDV